MTATTATTPRAGQQRARILDAAQACFVRDGFHAASMASIAEAAGMSAGLIYRYFESKNAIILAIIERQLRDKLDNIAKLAEDPDIARKFVDFFGRLRRGDPDVVNPALLLEIGAQATRDPQIGAAMAHSDRAAAAALGEWLRQITRARGLALDDAGIRARGLALQCLFDGLAMRAVKDPDLDPALLAAALAAVLPQLLASDPASPHSRETAEP
ncbi:MAG: TetR/AcrR family transcriptional regulator [Steroidobacteraceae bacterium]|jgi:AcrR family transcriptional regulator|nr:TetR/AcrR family transcriptional regulator [Steroidobacteraceae bacterium]